MHRLLIVAPLIVAAAPAGVLSIGGQAFAQVEILDARTIVAANGAPAILITFTPEAAKRFEALTRANLGRPLPFVVDGREITAPRVMAVVAEGAVEMDGVGSMPEAQALAKRIAGKDPVPESLEE